MSEPFLNLSATDLHYKFVNRNARIGVVGLGYVGLPLAVEFGRAGFTVIGIDKDAGKCEAINRGESQVQDVRAELVADLVARGRMRAVPAMNLAGQLDTINICVPTPLRKTRDPDLSYVVDASQTVRDHLRPGMLVVLESTTYPGTTEEIVRKVLEETGLKAGSDFFLAYSPERVDPGNRSWATKNVPKVVGGLTPDCARLASSLYAAAVDKVVQVSSPRAAEMVKILENTFRAINIALVNELAMMCDRIGIDVWEVIDAAATKPFGFMPFYPGPGLGGHCIPIDPFYLSWKVREVGFDARFIELAGQINGAMPYHVVDKISDALNENSKALRGANIFVIGVAYKPDVEDVRESPALDVIKILLKKGAHVTYHDPLVENIDPVMWNGTPDAPVASIPLHADLISESDCVVILTNHQGIDYEAISANAALVVDTRNALRSSGANVYRLGAPNPPHRNPDIQPEF